MIKFMHFYQLIYYILYLARDYFDTNVIESKKVGKLWKLYLQKQNKSEKDPITSHVVDG